MNYFNAKHLKYGVAPAALLVSTSAFAVDPEYTSVFGPLLETINMTAITADVAAFAGMALALGVIIAGIAFVRGLLRKSTAG